MSIITDNVSIKFIKNVGNKVCVKQTKFTIESLKILQKIKERESNKSRLNKHWTRVWSGTGPNVIRQFDRDEKFWGKIHEQQQTIEIIVSSQNVNFTFQKPCYSILFFKM